MLYKTNLLALFFIFFFIAFFLFPLLFLYLFLSFSSSLSFCSLSSPFFFCLFFSHSLSLFLLPNQFINNSLKIKSIKAYNSSHQGHREVSSHVNAIPPKSNYSGNPCNQNWRHPVSFPYQQPKYRSNSGKRKKMHPSTATLISPTPSCARET